jgi:hypothetical protein
MDQDGRIVPVRLAMFAEMVKSRPWTPKALRQIGGAEGVGVAFLQETFNSRFSNPKSRQHLTSAQSVLKSILPDIGSELRGKPISYQQLLRASGKSRHPSEFAELLAILDSETRLITPCDPERGSTELQGTEDLSSRFYQLTHDYLVPSVRKWLEAEQGRTLRGRAELLLADRLATWKLREESRLLPTLTEWIRIALFTNKATWTRDHYRMMYRKLPGVVFGSIGYFFVGSIVVSIITAVFASLNLLMNINNAIVATLCILGLVFMKAYSVHNIKDLGDEEL